MSPHEGLSLEGPPGQPRTHGNVPPPQTSTSQPTLSWFITKHPSKLPAPSGFWVFCISKESIPTPRYSLGVVRPGGYWGALHSPPPVLTEQHLHPPPSLGSDGPLGRGHRGSHCGGRVGGATRSRVSGAPGLDPSPLQVMLQERELWPPEPFPLGLQNCGEDCAPPPTAGGLPRGEWAARSVSAPVLLGTCASTFWGSHSV